MKRFLIGVSCFLLLFGCSSDLEGYQNYEYENDVDVDVVETEKFDKDKLPSDTLEEKYEKWAYYKDGRRIEDSYIMEVKSDCLSLNSVWGEHTYEGDLLSALIVSNDQISDEYNIDIYKYVEYLKQLDVVVGGYYDDKYFNNLNMNMVCNLGDKIDLVQGDHSNNSSGDSVLLMRNGEEVFELSKPSDKQIYQYEPFGPNGLERSLCGVSNFEKDYITWACLENYISGGEFDTDERFGGEIELEYDVDFNGEIKEIRRITYKYLPGDLSTNDKEEIDREILDVYKVEDYDPIEY